MFSKTKAKRFALGLALALALAAAPQALAVPSGSAGLGGAVYGWLADLWQSVSSLVGTHDEAEFGPVVGPNGPPQGNFGPWVGPNGEPTDFGPVATPNGLSSDSAGETGPWALPDGDRAHAGDSKADSYGLDGGNGSVEETPADDEFGPWVIPNG